VTRIPLSWWSAADLLAREDGDDEPIVFEPPTRPSSLKGRPIPARTDRVTAGHADNATSEEQQ
jgi:hypothetical protein